MAIPLDFLAALTGQSQAAMMPPELADLMRLAGTPPFIPQQGQTVPMAPQLNVPPANGNGTAPTIATRPRVVGDVPFETPAAQPLDYNAILARANQMAGQILGPAAAEPQPGLLQSILKALGEGIQVGISQDPGAALGNLQQRRGAEALNRQERQDRREATRQALAAQLYTGELTDAREDIKETRRVQRDEDREFRQYMNRQREILGDREFRSNETALERMWEEKKERDRREAARITQAKTDEENRKKDVRTQANTIFDDYKSEGISRSQAVRFAELEVNGTPLPAADRKAYDRTVKSGKEGKATPGAKERLAQFEIKKGQLGAAIERGDSVAERAIRKQLDDIMAKMPSYIKTGYGKDDQGRQWPYAKVRGTQQGAAAQQAASESPTRAQSRVKLEANGYSAEEANRELDRLGIK